MSEILNYILHVDKHLAALVNEYGAFAYGILFLILFCETGLVLTPFLPGDSLLFAAGALAGIGVLDLPVLLPVLFVAVVLGDNTNYWIGHWAGPRIFVGGTHRLLKKEYLERTHRFFEKFGRKAVILGRFVPIVRTFTPFVAGLGRMNYRVYLLFDLVGTTLWIGIFTVGGYFFGNLPFVQKNFSVIVVAIILVSVAPILIEWIKARREFRLDAKE
jgi:membrane-associated protein